MAEPRRERRRDSGLLRRRYAPGFPREQRCLGRGADGLDCNRKFRSTSRAHRMCEKCRKLAARLGDGRPEAPWWA